MLKKTLAILMAAILALGIFSVGVFAEDLEEPEYTPATYTIEQIVAAVEGKKELILHPTDIIVLPEQEGEEGEGIDPAADVSAILIVEYYAGKDAFSPNGATQFMDYAKSGYAVCDLGDYPNYAMVAGSRKTDYPIDYESVNEYAFTKEWKVTSAYSGKEFNRVTLEAVWEVPVLTGWAGYKTMLRGYIKTIIDYVISYLAGVFTRIGDFLV